jgi:hypothetical protein
VTATRGNRNVLPAAQPSIHSTAEYRRLTAELEGEALAAAKT